MVTWKSYVVLELTRTPLQNARTMFVARKSKIPADAKPAFGIFCNVRGLPPKEIYP